LGLVLPEYSKIRVQHYAFSSVMPSVFLIVPCSLEYSYSLDHILSPGNDSESGCNVKENALEKRVGGGDGRCHGDNGSKDLGTGGNFARQSWPDFNRQILHK